MGSTANEIWAWILQTDHTAVGENHNLMAL